MIQKLAPHVALLLTILGLSFLVAATWTIGRADLGTTLGLASTGVAFLVIEWSVS